MSAYPTNDGMIAPSSGHSPFLRANLPSSTSFNQFPSTSLSSPSHSSPYVTQQQPPARQSTAYMSSAHSSPTKSLGGGDGGKTREQQDARGQTLEEMYSAPENTLEIEVREPRTQGK